MEFVRPPRGFAAQIIATLEGGSGYSEEASRLRLQEAAATLGAFVSPAALNPAPGHKSFDERARLAFLEDIEPVTLRDGKSAWRLSTGARSRALKNVRFETQRWRARLAAAAEANRDPNDAVQTMLLRVLSEDVSDLRGLSYRQLAAIETLWEWFGADLEGLPPLNEVRRALSLRELLKPFRELTQDAFVGREVELARLAAFVGVSNEPIPSLYESLAKAVLGQKPLFLHGPGGVGKSTLLAHFILSHADRPGADALRFAMLDIDRPSVDPRRPLTFILEALDQLSYQLQGLEAPAAELRESILAGFNRAASSRGAKRGYGWIRDLSQFAYIVSTALRGMPLLLVVDTFEEAQYLGPDVVRLTFDFLRDLQRSLPEARIIVSGRVALAANESVASYPLTELPAGAASTLLKQSLSDDRRKVLSDDDLASVLGVIGGSPMVIRLAARVLEEESPSELRSLLSNPLKLKRVRSDALQARLYSRILAHVHCEDTRKLAMPGLLVRRVTPEVIREVLAGPCGIVLSADKSAETLYRELAREVALVVEEDGGLRHRPDLRRVMLDAMQETVSSDVARRIDDNAVIYWATQPGVIARAEELYHRMRRGDGADLLEPRWMEEAAPYLRGAVEEVSPRSRPWLANKLSVSLDMKSRSAARDEEWEAQVARIADRYIENGQPQSALKVLREREGRGGKLALLEARALLQLHDVVNAERVAHEAFSRHAYEEDLQLDADLLLLLSTAAEQRGDFAEADKAAERAVALAQRSDLAPERLEALLRRLRLHRLGGPDQPASSVRSETIALVRQIGHPAILADPVLLRETAAELGDMFPDLLERALAQEGSEVFELLDDATLERLVGLASEQAPNASRFAQLGKVTRQAALVAVREVLSPKVIGASAPILMRVLQQSVDRPAPAESSRSRQPKRRPLSASGLVEFAVALRAAFTVEDVELVLRYGLGRRLYDITSPTNALDTVMLDLAICAHNEGWLADLIEALVQFDPKSKLAWPGPLAKARADSETNSPTKDDPPPKPGPILDQTDLQRGRWGGQSKRDGRDVLIVLRSSNQKTFKFDVIVRSTDGSPLLGPVVFHLHNTFAQPRIQISRVRHGVYAILEEVESYGVFVIGVQVKARDDKWTSLEIDLAGLSGLPSRFLQY